MYINRTTNKYTFITSVQLMKFISKVLQFVSERRVQEILARTNLRA